MWRALYATTPFPALLACHPNCELCMQDAHDDTTGDSKPRSPRSPLLRWAIIIILVLLVPIVPFLIFGPAFEAEVRRYLHQVNSPWILATLVAVVLATDVFCPCHRAWSARWPERNWELA